MKDFFDYTKEEVEEVQDKIEYNVLETEFEKYSNIKDKVRLIIKYLNNSVMDLDFISKKVVDGYSIDGSSGDDGFLENTRKEIKSIYNYLNNTILPDVEKKLKELSEKMEKIDLD